MKHVFIYSASLSLLLAVSPSYGDQWERQLNARAMAQEVPFSAGITRYDWPVVEANRRHQLERSLDPDAGFDIESLPPTAAGPRKADGMSIDWREVEINREKQLERSMH